MNTSISAMAFIATVAQIIRWYIPRKKKWIIIP